MSNEIRQLTKEFRIEMLKLSQTYPFIKKVIVSEEAWTALCNGLDRDLQRAEGQTEKHIDDRKGSMRIEQLFVERG